MLACFFSVKGSMIVGSNLRQRRLFRYFCMTIVIVCFGYLYMLLKPGKKVVEIPFELRNDKDFYIDSNEVDMGAVKSVFDEMKSYFYKYYCIVPNVITPEDANVDDKITLVLHSSITETLRVLVNHVYNWQGPVSVAIVFPAASVFTTLSICMTDYLIKLRDKHTAARQNLRIHFIFPHLLQQSCTSMKLASFVRTPVDTRKCRLFLNRVESFKSEEGVNHRLVSKAYPINVARNVARNYSTSSYILIADLEHFFSENFEQKVRGFANELYKDENNTNLLLTYRIFEVAHSMPMPLIKANLFDMYSTGLAQLFHATYTKIHNYPMLDEWFKFRGYGEDTTGIQFILPLNSSALEPQFVSLRNIPLHDETFYYPFRDNTVLRWECCRAGYKFAMLHDVFMFHPGMKTVLAKLQFDGIRRKLARKAELAMNGFKRRMNYLYPDTEDLCPSL